MNTLTLTIEDRPYSFTIEESGTYPYRLDHLSSNDGLKVFPYLPIQIDQTLKATVNKLYPKTGVHFQTQDRTKVFRTWGTDPTHYYHCRICNDLYFNNALNSPESALIEEFHICFRCAYWELQSQNSDNELIIDGAKYVRGPGHLGGMGGKLFIIEMWDGTIIKTNDLWYIGKPPEFFQDRFPNTAKFIDGYCRIETPQGQVYWHKNDTQSLP